MLGRVTSPAASAASIPGQPDLPPTPEGGLDDAEVARRRAAGLGNAPPPPTTRTYAQILRENVFTFVNNILFALGIALVAVGRPIDALVSLTVISTNVIVGIVQEIRAKRTLDRIALLTRPTATVVRSGGHGRDPARGPRAGRPRRGERGRPDRPRRPPCRRGRRGRRVAAHRRERRRPQAHGDQVFSGSYATTGAGRYVVDAVASGSFANRITAGARSFRRVITPLQAEINLVIRVVLGIVLYLEVLLVVRGFVQRSVLGDVVADATLLAGLVPNGLFVSIAVAYALGAIRILRFGALVQQANSIESPQPRRRPVPRQDRHADREPARGRGRGRAGRRDRGRGDRGPRRARGVGDRAQPDDRRRSPTRWPREALPQAAEVPFSSARKWSAVAFAARRHRPARDHRARRADVPAAVPGGGRRRGAGRVAGAGAHRRRLDRARAAGAPGGHVRRRGGAPAARRRGRGDAAGRDAGPRPRRAWPTSCAARRAPCSRRSPRRASP